MIFEKFNPKVHSIEKLAELRYEIDFRTFDVFFKSKDDAVNANLTLLKSNVKSEVKGTYLCAILDDNKNMVGICSGAIGVNHSYFKDFSDGFKYLKFFDVIKFSIMVLIDACTLLKVNKKDFYIGEIGIDSSQRGKGYGREAILNLIEIARKYDCDRVVLDVDFKNEGAYRLYKSIGFEVYDKKSINILFFKRGMMSMEYKLK